MWICREDSRWQRSSHLLCSKHSTLPSLHLLSVTLASIRRLCAVFTCTTRTSVVLQPTWQSWQQNVFLMQFFKSPKEASSSWFDHSLADFGLRKTGHDGGEEDDTESVEEGIRQISTISFTWPNPPIRCLQTSVISEKSFNWPKFQVFEFCDGAHRRVFR